MTMGIAIIGSGFMGRTWATVAAAHLPGGRLIGVTGGQRAETLAADLNTTLFDDLAAVAANPDVDVVVLATPPAGHREQGLLLAAAGKHLLVEKPMAATTEQARELTAACAAADVRLAVVSQQRFRRVPCAAKQAIDEGLIGPVTMVRVTGTEVGFWDTAVTGDAWKLDPAQQTAFASWGAHACDLLRWLVGDEAELAFGLISEYHADPPPGRSAMVSYRFRGGQMAQLWMSYDIPTPGLGSGMQMTVVGRDGLLELDAYGALRLATAEGWRELAVQQALNPTDTTDPVRLAAYRDQLADLLVAVTSGGRPAVDGTDGIHTMAMIDAAEASARSGRSAALDGTLQV